jgi:translation initiation factor 2 alpha subunit (eIF-2alpha)
MFYYSDSDFAPIKGTVVIAHLINSDENEHCLYVTLPEYNNSRGIVQKAELPKKVKKQRETLNNMKHQNKGAIVCVVSEKPKFDKTNNSLELIELSVKGIDKIFEPKILARQKNMERIIKLIKFISIEFNLPFDQLIDELRSNIVTPLLINEIPTIDDIDDYDNMYNNFLRQPQDLLTNLKIDTDVHTDIHKNVMIVLKTMIKEVNASSSLDFQIKIWKCSDDMNIICVMRKLFEFIKSKYDKIDLRYIGSPKYQIHLHAIDPNVINDVYQSINESIIEWLRSNNVTGYDLQFDIQSKEVKNGDITINYPFKIELS